MRRLAVGGVDWGSTVAGSAEVYVSSSSPINARSITELVDQSTALPNNAYYSSGQVVLRNPQHLFVLLVSPTASTTYAAGGGGFDVPDRPTARFTNI